MLLERAKATILVEEHANIYKSSQVNISEVLVSNVSHLYKPQAHQFKTLLKKGVPFFLGLSNAPPPAALATYTSVADLFDVEPESVTEMKKQGAQHLEELQVIVNTGLLMHFLDGKFAKRQVRTGCQQALWLHVLAKLSLPEKKSLECLDTNCTPNFCCVCACYGGDAELG